MNSTTEAPAATGAPDNIRNQAATKQAPTPAAIITDRHRGDGLASHETQSGSDWLFSPVRRAAYEAEQRALEHFANIAEAMPDVAKRLTAELLPDPAPGEVVARRQP